jgi:2-keto-4-pentenoate hydratase/2-oxohepta-3-ene-1,7-dioic acid hydratase in catechol pathway
MKVSSYLAAGAASYGVVNGTGIIDGKGRLGKDFPDLLSVLQQGALNRLRDIAGEAADYDIVDVEFLPVIPKPGKIIGIGGNYREHVLEANVEMPQHPMIFTRFSEGHVGSGQPMLRPPESEQFDFEAELAFIIGKGGRRIPVEKALDHVAGYANYNDGSIRDWQFHTSQYTVGKSFYRSGAFGPYLVTTDEIPDPSVLTLESRLNGEVMQHASTSDLMFSVPELIAYISSFTILEPGDVVITGTPSGVGIFRKPPVWMKPGDVIEIELTGLGILRNPIADEVAGIGIH